MVRSRSLVVFRSACAAVTLSLTATLAHPSFAQISAAANWAACEDWKNGDNDRVIAGCTAIIQANADPPTKLALAYKDRGNVVKNRGDFDRAMADYDHAIALAPAFAAAYADRGQVWAAKNELDRAMADLDRAIALNPMLAPAYFARSRVWYKKYLLDHAAANRDSSLADLGRAIELDPQNAELVAIRGRLLEISKNHDRAMVDYRKAVELSDDARPILVTLGEAGGQAAPDQAMVAKSPDGKPTEQALALARRLSAAQHVSLEDAIMPGVNMVREVGNLPPMSDEHRARLSAIIASLPPEDGRRLDDLFVNTYATVLTVRELEASVAFAESPIGQAIYQKRIKTLPTSTLLSPSPADRDSTPLEHAALAVFDDSEVGRSIKAKRVAIAMQSTALAQDQLKSIFKVVLDRYCEETSDCPKAEVQQDKSVPVSR
jgi:tetratricopeptide (TPR) repeat protein